MPGDYKPRNWTRRARRRGGILALLALAVIVAYWIINWSWLGVVALGALDPLLGEGATLPFWSVVGLATLFALPFFVADQLAGWAQRRKDRRRD